MNSAMVTVVSPVQIGQRVRVVSADQFGYHCTTGAVVQVQRYQGEIYVKVAGWAPWVPVKQVDPC